MSFPDLAPLLLTLRLATVTTLTLLVFGMPLAWWLARTRCSVRPVIEALVALPPRNGWLSVNTGAANADVAETSASTRASVNAAAGKHHLWVRIPGPLTGRGPAPCRTALFAIPNSWDV